MDLVHMIYCSAARSVVEPQALRELLDTCRRNNAERGITGVLLYRDGSFFQILEGERQQVEAMYERIGRDQRHFLVSKIIMEPIDRRDFGAWSMGFAALDEHELCEIDGLCNFFARGGSFEEMGEGRAKTLLAAFNEGRWRARIEEGTRLTQHA